MPVTVKLSRNFYERLGDDIAGEFVDWFNAVDATYQIQLREINELNWQRFRAELDARTAELRGEMTAMEARLRREMVEMEARLRGEIANLRAELLKWMFIYWSGTVLTVAGLMVGFAILLRS